MTTRRVSRPRPEQRKYGTYHGTLLLIALLASLFAVFIILLLERPALTPLKRVIETRNVPGDWSKLAFLLHIAIGALVAGVLAYGLGAATIAFARLATYNRRLHRYCRQYLTTYAPLRIPSRLRMIAATRGQKDAQALLDRDHCVLVLGSPAAGKTTLCHTMAMERSGFASVWMQFLHRRRIPVVIPLVSAALDWEYGDVDLMESARIFAERFATRGLMGQVTALIKAGRVVLLLDGLDEIDSRLRSQVLDQTVRMNQTSRVSVVLFSRPARTVDTDIATIAQNASFDVLTIEPITSADVVASLKYARLPSGVRRPHGEHITTLLEDRLLLEYIADRPTLAALHDAWCSPEDLPAGYGHLLRRSVEKRLRATTHGLDAGRAREIMSVLAASLWNARQDGITVAPGTSLGKALAEWLNANPPPRSTIVQGVSAWTLSPEEAQLVAEGALASGMLSCTLDRRVITVSDFHTHACLTAFWLELTDTGGPIEPELLDPRWASPVLLWSSIVADPQRVISRIALLGRGTSSAGNETHYAALALAVIGAVAAYAPILAEQTGHMPPASALPVSVDQGLRDVLDLAQRFVDNPLTQDGLADGLRTVQEHLNDDVTIPISYLTHQPAIGRLVRAQLLWVLGLLATPQAIRALLGHLRDTDPLIRQSLHGAVVLAGEQAVEPLRHALGDPDEVVRTRAGEALALLGDAARKVAMEGLASADPMQRAASARTLGALRTVGAVPQLIAVLTEDNPTVQMAAAAALGKIADDASVNALLAHAVVSDPRVRTAVARALGQTHANSAVPTLLTMLDDAANSVRAAAACALGILGDRQAIQPLRAHLRDVDPTVQSEVTHALRRISQTRSLQ